MFSWRSVLKHPVLTFRMIDLTSIKLPGSAYDSCLLSEGGRELTALSLRPLRWGDKGHMEEGESLPSPK